MRRPVLMFLLALGVVGGYGSAIAHAVACHHWQQMQQQEAMYRAYHPQALGNCNEGQPRPPMGGPMGPMGWGGPFHQY